MTTSASTVLANPYIGPRSFETGERLFGRDSELRNLLNLLIAERIVLLHSPSGAGKSSLIKAALLPALARKRFLPLPPIRVNQELPPGAPPEANRYVYSALLSLEERRPPEQHLPLAALAGLTLADYLQTRVLPEATNAGADPVLIFDQFEEVLTVEALNQAAKHTFFQQLGEALADKQLWALLAMREDYLAALAPYLAPIPGRLKDTFRLDLLGVEASQQAMRGPALAAGMEFAPEAAARLADELRRSTVQRPDGSVEQVLGPYVEPVQLQVVCLRLWDRLFVAEAGHAPLVSLDDIEDVGDVDSALASYYVERVRAAAAATGVEERAIRDWFDRELITAQGQRGQVMREARASGGLDNAVIARLIDAHLVRGDDRHGTTWYELAHDRLVGPVQQSNAAWRAWVLTPFQQQALLWEEQGRSDGLLLQGGLLREGEAWAEAHAGTLTEAEQAFLEACRKARAAQEQQARANRRIRQALAGVVLVAVVAIGLAIFALQQRQAAQEQSRIAQEQRQAAQEQSRIAQEQSRVAQEQSRVALVRQLDAQALTEQSEHPQRSLLLRLLALKNLDTSHALYPEMKKGLYTLLSGLGGTPLLGHSSAVSHAAFSNNGRWLVTADETSLRFWHPDSWDQSAFVWQSPDPTIKALALSADSTWAAAGFDDGSIRLWQLDTPLQAPRVLESNTDLVDILAFSPDNRWLMSGQQHASLHLHRMDALDRPPAALSVPDSPISISFSPNSRMLAVSWGALGGMTTVFSMAVDGTVTPLTEPDLSGSSVGFSPDSARMATVDRYDYSTEPGYLWNAGDFNQEPETIIRKDSHIKDIAFSLDGQWIASIADDSAIELWSATDLQSEPRLLAGAANNPTTITFSPDSRFVAVGSQHGETGVWSLEQREAKPVILRGQEGAIETLGFSPDSSWLITTSKDSAPRVWRVSIPGNMPTVLQTEPGLLGASFSPDGRLLQLNSFAAMERWDLEMLEKIPQKITDEPTKKSLLAILSSEGLPTPISKFDPEFRWFAVQQPFSNTIQILFNQRPGMILPIEDQQTTFESSADGRWLTTVQTSSIKLWDMGQYPPNSIPLYQNPTFTQATFSPDSQWLAFYGPGQGIALWSLADSPTLYVDQLPESEFIKRVTFSPNKNLIAGTKDQSIFIWTIDKTVQKPIQIQSIKDASIKFNPNPKHDQILVYNHTENAQIWQIHTQSATQKNASLKNLINADFSTDGQFIIGDDGINGIIWSFDQQGDVQLTATLTGTTHLVVSHNGKQLAGLQQNSVLLWDINRLNVQSMNISIEDPRGVVFSPDSRTLLLFKLDTAYLWPTASQDVIDLACTTAGRNLSLEEWHTIAGPDAQYQKVCDTLP